MKSGSRSAVRFSGGKLGSGGKEFHCAESEERSVRGDQEMGAGYSRHSSGPHILITHVGRALFLVKGSHNSDSRLIELYKSSAAVHGLRETILGLLLNIINPANDAVLFWP
jgi:hypothetical protein